MKNLPKNIGIIMDGNRRWASNRKLPTAYGHSQGVKALKKIVKSCSEINISQLNIFAFSSENWKRDPLEIRSIMHLIETYLKSEIAELNSQNICFKVFGNKEKINKKINILIESAEKITCNNNQ